MWPCVTLTAPPHPPNDTPSFNDPTPKHESAEDGGIWVVECRTRLRCTGGHAWCTRDRTALEWAGGMGATNDPAESGVNSAGAEVDDRNSSTTTTHLCRSVQGEAEDDGGGQELRSEESTDAAWELVYRGKRSECVVGSLSLGE